MYILVDEYDNSVNKALGDTKAELYQSLYVERTSDNSDALPKKRDQREQQSLFKRFFSTIKDKLSEGGVGRVFITGVSPIALNDFTSGFNIAKHITHHEEFETMCGITDLEISNVLDQMVPKDPIHKAQLMRVMKDNYNGYMFTPTQTTPLYNTTLVIYFLGEFARLKKIPIDLVDPNVQPSESGLEIITKTALAEQVVTGLYQNEEQGVYMKERISRTIATRDMVNLLQTNPMYILSFLYYLGALTQSSLPKGKETGTVFKIPNQVIRTQFMDLIKQRLAINENIQIELTKAVNTLIEERDIGPLCEIIQEKVLSQLTGNDVDHSLENGLKLCFLLALNLSGRKVETMNEYRKGDQDYTNWGDLVIANAGIHIEYKNITLEQISGVPSGKVYRKDYDSKTGLPRTTWDEGVSIAKEIVNLNDEQLGGLKVIVPKTQDKQTINHVWENAKRQTKDNQKWISDKIGTSVDSFCVLRVGLYRLKHAKI